MLVQIVVVSQAVFPVAALPYATFALCNVARRAVLFLGQAARESRLDLLPARRIVGIARGQDPHAMQMFRQDHHGNQSKRQFTFYVHHRVPEQFNIVRQQMTRTLRQCDGEKIAPPGMKKLRR